MELESKLGHLSFPDGIYGSSIGAVIGTAVAFGLKASIIRQMLLEDFHIEDIVPPVRLGNIQNVVKEKGAFSMEPLRKTILQSFEKQGIHLQSKTIQDANQKLFIAVSDLTSRQPVFLTGKVPLLDALCCSCCIPLVFKPQVIGNHIYVDGGLYMRDIQSFVPDECIVFSVDHSSQPLNATTLNDYPFSSFLKHIFFSKRQPRKQYSLQFQESSIELLQKLDEEAKLQLIESGRLQCRTFLAECLA